MLSNLGFEVFFVKRPTRKDGCLTAWKKSIFEKADPDSKPTVIDFSKNALDDHMILTNVEFVYMCDNIATMVKLVHVNPNPKSNTSRKIQEQKSMFLTPSFSGTPKESR